jgi:hypothetical protein
MRNRMLDEIVKRKRNDFPKLLSIAVICWTIGLVIGMLVG